MAIIDNKKVWHQEVCGIIIDLKRMMPMKIMLTIIKQIIARQEQANLLNVRQK